MTTAIIISILMAVLVSSTPILLAALGELVAEKAGVLNLGVEGMMLIGAVTGFAATAVTGSLTVGFLAAALAGVATAMIFALLALGLSANQVATGLALTIFGIGVSALIGKPFVGRTVGRLEPLLPSALSEQAILRLVFGYDVIVYGAIALTLGVAWFLNSTRPGLILRAVGESDVSAHVIGYPVLAIRAAATAFGGALAGIGGAYFSLALTPMWAERITAGRGWIALALVVFAAWKPTRLLIGAWLFGLVMTMELQAKAMGVTWLAPEFLAMLPYLATVVVLTLISMRRAGAEGGAPTCLGKPFAA